VPTLPLGDFYAWSEACPKGIHHGYHPEAPTSESVYLLTSVTDPLPWPASRADWSWFTDPNQLVGYLVNVTLPDFSAVWLEVNQTDPHEERLPIQEVVELGEEISQGDKDFFTSIHSGLMAIANSSISKDTKFEAIKVELDRFVQRYGSTSSYELTADLFFGIQAAVSHSLTRLGDLWLPEEKYREFEIDLEKALRNIDIYEDSAGLIAELLCFDRN